MKKNKKFEVKQIRSSIGCTAKQRDVLRCLGLRGPQSTSVVGDNPAMRGQIMKVQHLISVSVKEI